MSTIFVSDLAVSPAPLLATQASRDDAEAMRDLDKLPALSRNVLLTRRHLRLSQDELAERCEVSRRTISRIERGEIPKVETLFALADALGTTVSKLTDDPERHGTLTRYLNKIRWLLRLKSAQSLRKVLEFVRGRRVRT